MISFTQNATRYISKLSNKLRRKFDMLSSRKEFSGSQGRTLRFLLSQTEDIYQKDIEEEYSIRPSTATQLLKQMEKNGLIIREPEAYDNRLKKIVVTDKALLYKQQVIEDLTTLEETLIKGISETDLQVFFRVTEKMMDNLSE
ncbi:MarR family winged helix-turn-helix transcriptional regulator [Dorea acetigenes]|uniref:MarR family winged helix-turn-helix transcriptional regulator n=1 Tax=Dorea acetigenes TaxID=2981787 RepID=A0ABT2RQV5_9FIRM|nr:MarR family winged helix-turn-helix transcriptional regulator [Dorea acetigenes]MCB6413502.1 MarR family winged helix-turn-helix transcriptional regulator [Faecalimonas umbilicata]MCU6687777.1 MarR family winged helix-turn-helix transcriptional regulator [Dorea acetigenes]SCJ55418.1 transcriptional regulator SlyA [uncultured Clostridium sp.]